MKTFLISLITLFIAFTTPAKSQIDEAEIDAFFSAVQSQGSSIVQMQLEKNPALAKAKDQFGFQAIHVLDYTDFEGNLSLLLSHGADINAQNDVGHSLLHVLIDAEFIQPVLNAGANLELKDKQGRTPLLVYLTERDNHEKIEALLALGANPNAKDNNGQNALGYAKRSNDPDLIKLLIKAGAKAD